MKKHYLKQNRNCKKKTLDTTIFKFIFVNEKHNSRVEWLDDLTAARFPTRTKSSHKKIISNNSFYHSYSI